MNKKAKNKKAKNKLAKDLKAKYKFPKDKKAKYKLAKEKKQNYKKAKVSKAKDYLAMEFKKSKYSVKGLLLGQCPWAKKWLYIYISGTRSRTDLKF